MKKIIILSLALIVHCGTSKIFIKELQTVSLVKKLIGGGNCTVDSAKTLNIIYQTQKKVMDGIVTAKKTADNFGQSFKLDKQKFCKAKEILNDIEKNWILEKQVKFHDPKRLGPGIWYYDSIENFTCVGSSFAVKIIVKDKLSKVYEQIQDLIDEQSKICS